MFRHKKPNYDHLTVFQEFSNSVFQYSLESLAWSSSVPRGSSEIQSIKLKSLPDSIFCERLFPFLFAEKFRLGNYIYQVTGSRLERYNPDIRVEKKEKKPFTISNPFKVKVDIDKDPGVVLSVK